MSLTDSQKFILTVIGEGKVRRNLPVKQLAPIYTTTDGTRIFALAVELLIAEGYVRSIPPTNEELIVPLELTGLGAHTLREIA